MTRRPRPVSARVRILAAILAVACVGFAVVGGVTFSVQRDRIVAEVDDRLTTQVSRLQGIADQQQPFDPDAPEDAPGTSTATEDLDIAQYRSVADYLETVVARLVPARNEASLALLDGEPRWVPSTLSGFSIARNRQLIDRALAETADGDDPKVATVSTPDGAMRFIAVPVRMDGDPHTGLYIRAVNLDAELRAVTTTIITYSIAGVATLVMIGIVGWFVTGRLLSPIRDLRDAADSITISDLGARIPEQGNDEISDLTRTVNSMLDRLESSVDVQRQLLDDVRHELKTPITIVRGHLEMMDPGDETDVETTRDIGIAELDRMTRLVDDIDMLASVEGGEQFTSADVDVSALTERYGELVAVIPDHTWSIESVGDGVIPGDPDRLLQAWLALADNAAKYTAVGSPIEVGSATDDRLVRLWVRDHGPGIPPAARHRIFRRFDRAQGTRTIGGSGLGLAIVDAITKAHGGICSVADTPGGGATFTIEIPTAHAASLPAPIRAGDVVLQREAAG